MRIPMLAIIIIFFIVFNIFFINHGNLVHELFESARVVGGRVMGAREEITVLPVAQAIKPKPVIPAKIENCEPLNLLTRSAIVIDSKSRTTLFEKNADQQMPIASITKLMTALTFLDNNPGWDKTYKIKDSDIRNGGKIYLRIGEEIIIKDLFYLTLVGSANTATVALARSSGLDLEDFIALMNKKSSDLNLLNTKFSDPTGLNHKNISTAREIAKLVQVAFFDEDIKKASLTKKYEFKTTQGRNVVVENTDALLDIFPQNGIKIIGGKTGYIKTSGYCFASRFVNQDNNDIIVIILGADSNNARFSQTKKLVNWVFTSYTWQ